MIVSKCCVKVICAQLWDSATPGLRGALSLTDPGITDFLENQLRNPAKLILSSGNLSHVTESRHFQSKRDFIRSSQLAALLTYVEITLSATNWS